VHTPGRPICEDHPAAPARDGEPVTLADGSRLLVRPLHAGDREGYAESIEAMSPRSRYLRFAAPKPRFSAKELDYLTHVDGDRHLALVALAGEPPVGVAVVRYVRAADGSAEVAIGVTDPWQGRGLGRLLLAHLIDRARRRGVTALTATTPAENEPSRRLLHAAGFALVRRDGVTNDYRLELTVGAAAA
jgi:GNAT superfamily N-acetyltransferase